MGPVQEKKQRNNLNKVEIKNIKYGNASRICVSSLRRGHANLLCIVPILVYVLREQYILLEMSAIYIKYCFLVMIKRERQNPYL